MHIPSQFNILYIFCNKDIPYNPHLKQIGIELVSGPRGEAYLPPVDINQIHIQTRNSSFLPEGNHTMRMSVKPYDLETYAVVGAMFNAEEFNKRYGNMGLF